MVNIKHHFSANANASNSGSALPAIAVTAFIFASAFVGFPSTILYLVLFCAALLYLCLKNIRAVMVGLCIAGPPFFGLVHASVDYSVTVVTVCLIVLQIFLLCVGRNNGIAHRFKSFPRYLYIMTGILLLLAGSYLASSKTAYNMYYIQFFCIYTVYYSLAGLLVVQSCLKPKDVLLPAMLFAVCIYPLYQFALLRIPARIQESSIGLRGLGELDSIAMGRVAGGVIVLAGCALWEIRGQAKQKILQAQIALALVSAGPIMWYAQTRQAMLAVVVTIILSSFFLFFRKRDITAAQRLIVVLVPVVITWGSLVFLNWAGQNLAQVRVQETFQDPLGEISRPILWRKAWQDILTSPVLGFGLGGYHDLHGSWPHNWFLEAWHDYGIIGAIVTSGLIIMMIMRARSPKFGHYLWAFIGIYWLIVAQASADIPRNSILFLFFTIALLLPARLVHQQEGPPFPMKPLQAQRARKH